MPAASSDDMTVVPPHSAHFTLPSPNDTSTCPLPPLPPDPGCYAAPLPWSELPLYKDDYVGLRTLDERRSVSKRVCEGVHMEIGRECWKAIRRVFVGGRGRDQGGEEEGPAEAGLMRGAEEVWHREEEDAPKLVLQV